MSDIYSLRLYDTELIRFSLEKRGLDGLVAEIISVQEEYAPLPIVGRNHIVKPTLLRSPLLWA